MNDSLFITDGGLETDLIHHRGFDLPCFAAFTLLGDEEGTQALRDYFEGYIDIAREHGVGALFDTVTWRANADWGEELGYSPADLDAANRRAVALMMEIRDAHDGDVQLLISGCVGPRGDAYSPDELMTADEAASYHAPQIATLAESGVDLVSALTLTYSAEAIGIARAAATAGVPAVISFTVETDGRLPSGEELRAAIETTDAACDVPPAYYMVNCAHPTHFAHTFDDEGIWLERIRGVRANASSKSHEELDSSDELDEGDPVDLAERYRELLDRLPNLTVLGGCCGTDHRHVAQVCATCVEALPSDR